MTDFQAALGTAVALPIVAGVLIVYWGYRLLARMHPQKMEVAGTWKEISIALKRAPVGTVLALFGSSVVLVTVLNIDVTYDSGGWRIAHDTGGSNTEIRGLAAYLSNDYINDFLVVDSLLSGGLMFASTVTSDGYYSVQGDYAMSLSGDSIRLDTLMIPAEIDSAWQSFLDSRGIFTIDSLTFLHFDWQQFGFAQRLID